MLLFVGCSKDESININELILSGDKTSYNNKTNNKPYTGLVFYTDKNDRVFLEGELINGKRVGIWKFWSQNQNKIEGRVGYLPLNYSGNHFVFHEDGKTVKNIFSIENDGIQRVIHGPSVNNNYEGREEVTYVDGLKHGSSILYYHIGELKGSRVERNYVNGILQGPSVVYIDSGKNKGDREERNYVDGSVQGPSIYYFSSGDREEKTYVNGLVHGSSIYYYSDGRKVSLYYLNGERIN